MSSEVLKGLKHAFGFFIGCIILFGLVFAAGFHSAGEIVGGVFQGNFSFDGSINLTNANQYGIKSTFDNSYLNLRHETGGSDGGTSSTGWNTRPINIIGENSIQNAIVDLGNNQFTLPVGNYYVQVRTSSYGTDGSLSIYNVNQSTYILNGTIYGTGGSGRGNYHLSGRFNLTSTSTLELREFHNTGVTTYGFGAYVGGHPGIQVFNNLEIWKLN